ncbi:hypothetical protein ACF059_18510 [Streptomyces sp. NPDC016562]|uniref:hypothetical protein n=1 Tax=Streptomyces sp. NPDC016562 TaxID=3364966 RepID=UPI0036FDC4DE
MGFSGQLVFARSERPLLEAPVFAGAQQDDGGDVTAWWPRPGGWQTLQFHDALPPDVLRAVVEWTGAPACVARVHDSDVALVSGLEPGGDRWQTWLNLDIAAEMTDRPPAELDARVPDDAARILAWAWDADAGEGVESAAIAQTLRSHEPCVENLFTTLLDRLGFPPATPPQPQG